MGALNKQINKAKTISSEGRESECLQRILESASLGVSIVQDGVIKFVNSEFERIVGCSRDELKVVNLLHSFLPEDRGLIKDKITNIQNMASRSSCEGRILNKCGKMRRILMNLNQIEYEGKRSVLIFSTDVTEHKRQAKENNPELDVVKKQLAKLEKIISSSPYHIFLYDSECRYIFVSPAAADAFGLETSDMVGRTWRELNIPSEDIDFYEGQLRKVFATGKSTTGQITISTVDGDRDYEFRLTPIHSSDGKIESVVGAKRDITEENRLRENLYFYIREITRAQEEERKRISRELHDETIQALAAIILNIADISEETMLPIAIRKRLRGLNATVNQLLEEVRRFCHELRPGLLERLGLIASLGILTDDLTKTDEIHCSLHVTGFEQKISPEAELMMFRIVQEGLRNVKKYSKARNAVINVDFGRETVKVEISDDGNGFKMPRNLSDFARQGKLGLMGIEERTRLLNGSLRVESTRGVGTTLTVEVPLSVKH